MRRVPQLWPIPVSHAVHPALPVFRLDPANWSHSIFYVPGHVMLVARAQADDLAAAVRSESADQRAVWLCEQARQVQVRWQAQVAEPFAPECLTVYLSNRCQSACTYCYAAQVAPRGGPIIDRGAVRAAAELVARHCAQRGRPFHLVLHGGGEPTLHDDRVRELRELTVEVAHRHGLVWRGYLATSGVLSEEQAHWLGRNFDAVGISCDGPPDIHDVQRPLADGSPTSALVARSARLIKAAGAALHIRATITPRSAHRQRELVQYFRELGADQVRLEPVYSLQGHSAFSQTDVPALAAAFVDAEAWANTAGMDVSCSLVRMDELHGPFCDVHRQTLHLIPDGRAVSCFFAVDGGDHEIGHFDVDEDRFVLDEARIAIARAAVLPDACRSCINAYHCSRGCPERCLTHARTNAGGDWQARCALARAITEGWLERSARAKATERQRRDLAQILAPANTLVDVDQICAAHARLGSHRRIEARRMPAPLWRRRGYDLDGPQIWHALGDPLPGRQGPLSIYVHVPFCDRRCGFCDCLSHRLSPQDIDQPRIFTDALLNELAAWAARGNLGQRPVTTVHFGGGSPAFLRIDHLARIVAALRQHMRIDADTEWAMEVTASSLGEAELVAWQKLGFSRLHVGVQTLEDSVRLAAGRRLGRSAVLDRLAGAARCIVTSVDVIYGLPGETLPGFLGTLADVDQAGVQGVSLYAFNPSQRNAAFRRRAQHVEDAEKDAWSAYAFFQAGDAFLRSRGLARNHFTHYARPADRNLYYRHEQRGEDLLALGPTADGVFGDLHYRHLDWPDYSAGVCCGLEGGVRERPNETQLRPVIAELMSGTCTAEDIRDHLAGWLKEGLLVANGDAYTLTATGSWFVTHMIDELEQPT